MFPAEELARMCFFSPQKRYGRGCFVKHNKSSNIWIVGQLFSQVSLRNCAYRVYGPFSFPVCYLMFNQIMFKYCPNDPRTSPERLPNDPRTTPNEPWTTPERSPNDPERLLNDAQTISNRTRIHSKSTTTAAGAGINHSSRLARVQHENLQKKLKIKIESISISIWK